ncbi:MAG: DUF3810 domain-containing protein [Turicibacter sp.]|nr:DUF3810 domain-containing protein [Turicibacter sp.]
MWKKALESKYRFYTMSLALLVTVCVVRWWARGHPEVFLRVYTDGINRWMIQGVSRFSGLFHVSLFEVLLLSLLITGGRIMVQERWRGVLKCAGSLVFIYSAFMLMWGLNYERPSIATDFALEMQPLSTSDLKTLYLQLIELANVTRAEVSESEAGIFLANQRQVEAGFEAIEKHYGRFGGEFGSYKTVVTSDVLSRARIAGVYGMFTGEPNVNAQLPDVARLFTVAHESAHQRGVAHEDETNFVAFMACTLHPEADYRYAGYFNALVYAREALMDTGEIDWVVSHDALIDQGVARDFNDVFRFWQEREGVLDGIVNWGSDLFLNFHNTGEYVGIVDFLYAYFDL